MKASRNFYTIVILLICAAEPISAQYQNSCSIALTGDAIITRKLSVYNEPAFLKMVKVIRDADAAFTNLEMLLHNYESYPMHQSGGTYMRADPQMADELVWAGFDMVSMANNHTGDYGVGGMRSTIKHVNRAGLVHAGAGESLAEAREARFLETSNGRIALISCSSTFPDHSRAGKTRGDIPPRPGLSPIRHSRSYTITQPQMDQLVELGKSLNIYSDDYQPESRIRLLGDTFILGDTPGVQTKCNEEDLNEISSVVSNAKTLADITIVSIHAHERKGDITVPADFVVEFARAMIDAGADMVVGHGPHVLRGIEMYKGKPIFYSLGDFMFQNETLMRLPYENYERYDLTSNQHIGDFNAKRYRNDSVGFPSRPMVWEGVIAMPVWENGEFTSIEIHPLSLGFGQPRQIRGRPMIADEKLGKKIINDLTELSEPFGTKVVWKDGVGVVRLE